MKKILVIRFSSIGDILLTTPVLRCLNRQLGAEVHYLTKAPFAELVQHNPHVQKVQAIEKLDAQLLSELRSEGYDAVVDLHKNFRSFRVTTALRKRAYRLNKLNFRKWLLVNFKWDRLPRVSIVQRYLEAVAPLGVTDDGLGLDFYFPKELPDLPLTLPERYVVFAIGAAHQTKRLPFGKMLEILERTEGHVLLIGGPSEKKEGEALASALPGGRVKNLCGKLSLTQSAMVIQGARVVLAPDTGMMHLAAALQKEVISVWGNTVPAFGMFPYFGKNINRSTIFEVEGLPCRPCSKIGFSKCPKGHFKCMNLQPADLIARTVNQALNHSG
ncbi:MAG: glycosyltransferase family 9 protein [Saprospiraceae bacterium]